MSSCTHRQAQIAETVQAPISLGKSEETWSEAREVRPAPPRQAEATAAQGANKPLRGQGPSAVAMAAVEGGRRQAHGQAGEPAGSDAHRGRVSCAGAVGGARAGASPKPRPRREGSRPLTAAVFWRQRVPPARQPRTPPSALFGFELPARGEGTEESLAMGGGGAGRARRARGSGINSAVCDLPPRPPLLQYGLWRPRADGPRRVAWGRLTPPRDAAPGG